MALSPGTRLGPYEILAPLGAGGMGEVYRAKDARLGREVAIKVLPAALAADADRLRRFEKEARAASALNHPNIVTIYDAGTADGVSWIAMERIEGEDLRTLLVQGALPAKKRLSYATQIAEGLAKAHESGIVHRDLKPENVMVTREGAVKILDFGLAKLIEPSGTPEERTQSPTVSAGTQVGVVLGTVGYMSPEQAKGELLDFRSDQFSFGSILYELPLRQVAPSRAPTPPRRWRRSSGRNPSLSRPRRPRRPFRSAGSSSAASPRSPKSVTRRRGISLATWRACGMR